MKRIVITAVVAAVMALGAVGAVLASVTSASARSRPPIAYNGANGWSGGAVRLPVLYVGEANVFARVPHWSRWSKSVASGRGTLWVNTCSPTCSAGHYRKYRATLRLWRVAVRKGVAYFSRMRLSYRHGHRRVYTYNWGFLPGATIPGWNGGPGN